MKKWIIASVSAGAILVALVFGVLYVVRLLSAPERAAATLVAAVKQGDDASVYECLATDLRLRICSDSVEGAASKVGRLASRIESYTLEVKADDQVWLVKPGDQRSRVEMSVRDGSWPISRWRIDSIRGVRQEQVDKRVEAVQKWDKTTALPKGTKVVTRKPKAGESLATYDVFLENGEEVDRSEVDRQVLREPIDGVGWLGTGKKSSKAKTVTRVKIGTKTNKRTLVVTNPSKTIKASAGQVFVSWWVSHTPRGTLRVVLLGPESTKLVLKRQKLGGDWCYGYSGHIDYFGSFGPKGSWVAVVERDDKPAVWKRFKVQ